MRTDIDMQEEPILLVEDSPEAGLMEQSILDKAGFHSHLCKDGKQAWGWLQDNVPSLIISDWMMPEMDGVELCRHIRRDARLAHISFLLLTAQSGKSSNVTMAFDAGVDEFINKPIHHRELVARVRAGLRQRRLNDRLIHAEKLKAITTLTGGAAHDYNNKLASMMANVEILTHYNVSPDKAVILEDMKTAIQQMSELNRKLIAFSGQGKYMPSPINLNGLVEKVINLHHHRHSSWIDCSFESDLDEVEGDPVQMEQVVFHLLQNAVESLDGDGTPGKIIVTTSNIDDMKNWESTLPGPAPWALLQVRDQGNGMSMETLKRVYDPFYTTKFHGRGLGMAAVHGIVTNHRGQIQINSHPNQGTTVQVVLPFSS